uniref:NB-ARC domain-containing protein n=1 Tax=Leersia perrieri TaxID=77586 RepID=A0A0D9V530_9ORYZ
MEVVLSAVLGDIVSRSISFLIDKCYHHMMGVGVDLQCLHRLLLRIEAIVLDAEGRDITNQAMLRQLQMLREGMYKGYYLVDTIKHGRLQDETIDDVVGGHSSSSPKFRPTKRLCFSSRKFDMAFQEMERIVSFLLQEPLGTESLGVLPIIGPARVGKSTIVEYVCYDERVRSFFSCIVFCSGNDVENKNFADLQDSGVVKHRSCAARERSLLIIEFLEDGDLDEKKWRRLYSSRSCIPRGSKIIITSRSEKFKNAGTTQPLILNFLPPEAYWYFFKVLAFGSTNPDEHPFLASIAMEMVAGMYGCFVCANSTAALFRANSCTQFWRMFIRCHRDIIERHVILFGEHPHILIQNNHNIYIWGNLRDRKIILVDGYKTCARNDVPRVMIHEVQTGITEANGKFEVVLWRSRLPPYHEFVLSCEFQAQQHIMSSPKKKKKWEHESRSTPMEALLSAVLGDLVSRSISFFIDKYYRQKIGMGLTLQCLHRLLLRIESAVLDAEGRDITNQAMLRQLQMLREGEEEVGKMLDSLHSLADDMKEFVVFMKGYPHICRQPYSQHLVLEKCMFGRQAEMERIVSFLLQEPLGMESLGVLPIIGPARVGKSTIVEHLCYDERVRSFFSSIVFCNGNDVESKSFAELQDSGLVKHRSCAARERSLIIIEFLDEGDLDEKNWRRLYSSRSSISRGSKVIITSRSKRFENVGTTQPLMLNFLPPEAYWYFFKVITFGSTNPEEHPFLASIAMEMAAQMFGCFVGANAFASLFRANFCTQFWRMFLRWHRDLVERHFILFGEHPHILIHKNHNVYVCGNLRDKKIILVNGYKTCARNDAPRIMLHEIQTGIAEAHGKFEVVLWRSRLPPYNEYVLSCELQSQEHIMAKRKRNCHWGDISSSEGWVTEMETFLPAILSDLLGRSISFLVQRYRQQSSVQDDLEKLRLALVRVHVTVEEAESRHITNQAMLRQLDVLREAMYNGYYMLDALTYRAHSEEEEASCSSSSSSFAPSRFNTAKRLRLLAVDDDTAQLRRMVDNLGRMISDMREFIVFLKGYPRIRSQPYSAHLLLDKLMFGREKEVEQVIGFLLQPDVSGSGAGVLHIVGVARVGKSTLVEHVCHDERVHGRFSSVVCLSREDLEDMGDHRDLIVKHGSRASKGSSLVVLDLADDEEPLDNGAWRRLRSSAMCRAIGSKIIVTSRSAETVRNINPACAIELKFLHGDAYWYFFKTLAFGSVNPNDHPRLASIAMDISAEQKGGFIGATIASSLMRTNLDAHFWSLILKNMREYTQKHRVLFGKHPHELMRKNHPVYLWRMAESDSEIFLCHGFYTACSAKQEIPRVTFQEVLSGRVSPHGRFEVLAWRSQIPPCRSYLMSCSLEKPPGPPPHVLDNKKRPR